jgi:hypothetical protein
VAKGVGVDVDDHLVGVGTAALVLVEPGLCHLHERVGPQLVGAEVRRLRLPRDGLAAIACGPKEFVARPVERLGDECPVFGRQFPVQFEAVIEE